MESVVDSPTSPDSTVPAPSFWSGKRVLVTGHTGFKGSWLSLWLDALEAKVLGYATEPPTTPSLFEAAQVGDTLTSVRADVRSLEDIVDAVEQFRPEVVFHLAAQPLVRESYEDPTGTFATNVMGTVHLLEAIRRVDTVKAAVVVTSDKCYENRESPLWGYRESDRLGGSDPYSNSKGCAELVTASYRDSFFRERPIGLATARAGNVIGGGDWAQDRLVPDIVRAFAAGEPVHIRNPEAVRPWQHVLEPLRGYLMLAEALMGGDETFTSGWNFGPRPEDAQPVEAVVNRLIAIWGDGAEAEIASGPHPDEASFLRLDCSKARTLLGWNPALDFDTALDWTARWYRTFYEGGDARAATLDQIKQFVQEVESQSTDGRSSTAAARSTESSG